MNVYVLHLGQALARLGHRVELITLWRAAEHPDDTRPQDPVTVQELDSDGSGALRLITVSLPETAAAPKDELPRHLDRIAQALLSADPELLPRPDVLHGHYWLSGAVAQRLSAAWGIPFAVTFHTTARAKNRRAAAGESPEPAARENGEQALIETAGAVVVNAAAEAQELYELYGTSPQGLREIPPGVALEVFQPRPRVAPASDAAEPGQSPAAPVIGFAGRLQPLKGPQILLDALGLLASPTPGDDEPPLRPRLMLAGVGDPAFAAALHAQADRLGIAEQITWLGSLPVAELAETMRGADLWAVPSSSETFGLVALEAQACGTPTAATDVGGLRSAVADGRTGWLVAPRTAQAWARTLRAALADRPELARRGRSAAERALGFSWDQTARSHLKQVYGPLTVDRRSDQRGPGDLQ